ncbi:hypothetical protein [Kitasatospora camelliae]|uniref:Excreted virulence factor EspC (Type VII ESX diderm) n=1 Tax=Kitasatospora camelliae TaxID=3156397 RepID=A0AAU8JXN1_9ACTN
MSTGTGSTGGSGYRIEVESLRAFATQVRGLLKEFEDGAGGSKAYGQSGVARNAFGGFAEAEALYTKYEEMRDGLRAVLDAVHAAIDEAHHKADLTAANYEEQEDEASRGLKIGNDGWSVANPSAASRAIYGYGAASTPTSKPSATQSTSSSNAPQPSW